MAETKHTPGPWTAFRTMVRADGRTICQAKQPLIMNEAEDVTMERSKANARLIAAAPDLLEACKTGFATLWAMKARLIAPRNETEQAAVDLLSQRLDVLKAAIQKAEPL